MSSSLRIGGGTGSRGTINAEMTTRIVGLTTRSLPVVARIATRFGAIATTSRSGKTVEAHEILAIGPRRRHVLSRASLRISQIGWP